MGYLVLLELGIGNSRDDCRDGAALFAGPKLSLLDDESGSTRLRPDSVPL